MSATTPLETDSKKASSNIKHNSNVTITDTNTATAKEQWLPMVHLSHMAHDQKTLIETLLRENCHWFLKNGSDIGKLNDLNLEKLEIYYTSTQNVQIYCKTNIQESKGIYWQNFWSKITKCFNKPIYLFSNILTVTIKFQFLLILQYS